MIGYLHIQISCRQNITNATRITHEVWIYVLLFGESRERERERTGRENCVSHTDRQANFQRRPNIY